LLGIPYLLRHPKYHQFWTTQKGADHICRLAITFGNGSVSISAQTESLFLAPKMPDAIGLNAAADPGNVFQR
jgi:hypothetical protein